MRSIAATFLLIGLIVAGIGYGTWAEFYDIETSSGNYLTTHTLDLVLTDSTWDPNAQWGYFLLAPGVSPGVNGGYIVGQEHINIFNNGSYEDASVEIWFTFECHEDDDGNVTNGFNPGPESDTWKDDASAYMMLREIKTGYLKYIHGTTEVLINQGKLTLTGYTYLDDASKALFSPGDSISLYNLSQMHFVGLTAPEALDGSLGVNEYYLNQPHTTLSMGDFEVMWLDHSQSYWQGDVCEMTVHVRLLQNEP
ncbi:hypothetical protein [Thermococcus sp. ES12]|uniref:hypothetical protein n=1 Tax=Thermococcus sp. ES12 TaxID=1638246 RepID=UPI001430334E|nr:hypothetical protein [Thermococcus sp. ES12]NJE76762.1 hypothetical protein [Thermococcus sp. ES12]